jgi:betaine-aldehyde dehydrogenase
MSNTTDPRQVALNWIDGRWTDSPMHGDSIDPATGELIGRYASATRADVELAIAAARQAFLTSAWRTDRPLRARVLNAMADRIEQRRDELIDLLSLDNGKVKEEAALELDLVPGKLRYNAALALSDFGRAAEVRRGHLSLVGVSRWVSPV